MSDVLLITPPFTQLNTPYPATAYIRGFLKEQQIEAAQADLGIDVILSLFSRMGLNALFDYAQGKVPPEMERFLRLRHAYENTIDATIAFLQGKQPALARQICAGQFLPEGSRFEQLQDLEWAFGSMGQQDKAKHLATLYLEDLSDFIVSCVDPHFGFSRYAERLGRSANSFDELHAHLQQPLTYIDQITMQLLSELMQATKPKMVCFSVPFPGNLYSAFRCAQWIRTNYPDVSVVMGGGFPNTELRQLTEPRVFDYFHHVCLDDGERPLLQLYRSITEENYQAGLKRTYECTDGVVKFVDDCVLPDFKQSEVGTPDYTGLPLDRYISVIEMANPMHSLWSDGRWNKLTMAHGCYWGKCTFCDVSLDYIRLYEPVAARQIVDRMETLMAQTGENGFHFVDEAAPPALMREVAIEILNRGLAVTWWTNIRFERSFTRDLCELLARSGCVAVSGGLEVASDRLLKLIEKGVSVDQVARVTRYFTEAGIMVHAYLMYGYPTQTVQETIDSLEMVRQLFELGILQSGFWHQFALTAHSPVGLDPEAFGVMPQYNEISFAHNDVNFQDKTGIDHGQFSYGLKKSLYNYMHGVGFEFPLQDWFDFRVPKTKIPRNYIRQCLENDPTTDKPNARLLWLGYAPERSEVIRRKKGKERKVTKLIFHMLAGSAELQLSAEEASWWEQKLNEMVPGGKKTTLAQLRKDYEAQFGALDLFWFGRNGESLRHAGLLVL